MPESNRGISPVAYLSWACFGKKGMAALAATEAAVRKEKAKRG